MCEVRQLIRTSVERPLQIRWIHPGAARSAACIGEPDRADQWALLLFSRGDEFGIDSIQHQLGPTEHLEGPVVVDVAPRQIKEPIATLAVNCRTPEVQRGVRSGHDADVEVPSGSSGITGDEVVWFLPDLDADVNTFEGIAVGIAERPARKIEPFDDNSHGLSLPRAHLVATKPVVVAGRDPA